MHGRTKQAQLDFDEQEKHLQRVHEKLSVSILAFCKMKRFSSDHTFHMDDLRKFLVDEGIEFAPASPDRILRHCRAIKLIDYKVINRRESLYTIVSHFLEKRG